MGLAALILAGGPSRRFGGEKALFTLNGKPMISRVVEEMSKISDELAISCRTGSRTYERMFPGVKIIQDKYDGKGPMVGLVSALPEISAEYVAVVPCDSPRIRSDVVKFLFERAKGHDAAVPRWPNGYIEPLQAIYNTRRLLEAVLSLWGRGTMKLSAMLEGLRNVIFVPTDELREIDPRLETFLNVNYPSASG